MSAVRRAETLAPMGTDESEDTRGQAIKRRMDALGIGAGELAAEAGISRGQVYRVIGDNETVTAKSYGACERALDRIEYEHGHNGADAIVSTEAGLVEFSVDVDAIGVHVTVKGPVADAAEWEASITRIIRNIRAGDLPDSQT